MKAIMLESRLRKWWVTLIQSNGEVMIGGGNVGKGGEEDKAKEDKEEELELVDLGSDTDKDEDKGPSAPQ